MMHARTFCKLITAFALSGICLTGCKRDAGGTFSTATSSPSANLEETRQRLAEAEKMVAAQKQQLDRVVLETEAAKRQALEEEALRLQKETQIGTLQTQLNNHRDALVFADISATHQKGLSSIALDRYRQFIIDYPKSPLVVDANRAIAELGVSVARESKARANFIDPKRADRAALKNFQDGISTVDEISPYLRQKTSDEIIKLLGPPHRTYRNGTEIGYVDKIIDTLTGSKETLVITFVSDRAVSVRVGYRGREIKL